MAGIQTERPILGDSRRGEQGFLLVGVIVLVALVLLVLSIAAPIVAKDLRRERELEAIHRGQQYTRAIRLYYKKFNSYPATVKQLEKTNNERFLRQHYLDPMTGKDDWRLIAVGTNKTTVKGFFGEPLAGIASTGLGSAAGLQSGGLGAGTTGGAAGAAGATGGPGANGTTGSNDPGAVGTGTPGSTSGGTGLTGQSGSGTSSFGSSSFGSSSFGSSSFGSSSSGSAFGEGGSTGPFMGVGIPKDANSIITLNEQTNYSTWEFLYDPRIEQLYSKASLFGGGIATSSGGLGSASGLSSTSGTGSGNGSASGPGSGTGGTTTGGTNSGGTGTGGTAPTTPTAPGTSPQ
jgi:type II secretory pathway pseudopilin PulG